MPNRIIKESICTSDNIDQLSTFQENFFYRLIVNCDDFGRLDARPKILASKLYPLKRDIREAQIEDALRALTSAELVILYEVDGRPFLQMKTWDKHQQKRAANSKYPAPNGNQLIADDINCNQVISDSLENRESRNENTRIRETESETIRAREDAAGDGDMPFGITEEDITASLETDSSIEQTAKLWGLPCHEGHMLKARDMAREYTLDWLRLAIAEAGNHGAGWPYVASVLRNWKAKGGPEACKEAPRKRIGKQVSAQQYEQRNNSEEDLMGDDMQELLDEARKKRQADESPGV